MNLSGKIFLGALGAATAFLLFGRPAAAAPPAPSPQPNPLPFPPFPVPPGPLPTTETYNVGDSVLVPLLSLFPTGAPFPVDPAVIGPNEAVDSVRVLIDHVLPAGLLQGRVTAYHYGGPASDGWKVLEMPVPAPPFPTRVVAGKLLTTR